MRKSFPDPEARQAYMDALAYKALLHPKVSEAEAVSAAQIVHTKDCELVDNWKDCPACLEQYHENSKP